MASPAYIVYMYAIGKPRIAGKEELQLILK